MRLLFLLLMGALLLKAADSAICPKCGNIEVPYPLSTGPSCGQQTYNLTCNADQGVLVLPAASGNYTVLSIDGPSQTLILDSRGLLPNTCIAPEFAFEGFSIRPPSPFHFTSATKVMLFNCSNNLLSSPLNCSNNSPCRTYINEVLRPAAPVLSDDRAKLEAFSKWKECAPNQDYLCCTFTAGGRPDSRDISLRPHQCSSFVGVVNMDESVSPSYWTYGLQLAWIDPSLPPCELGKQYQCESNSQCIGSVCECNLDFVWDRKNGTCIPGFAGGRTKDDPALIAGVSTAFAAVMALAIAYTVHYRKAQARKKAETMRIRELSELLAVGSGGRSAQVFSGREMKRATNGFAKDRVLGSGGFGEVYLGKLDDGTTVAVKTAKIGNTKGTEQVINEVRILSQVNHRNLVRLLGCCVEMEQPLLVYEYVSNGTLLDHLSGVRGPGLDWRTRLQIALQTAQGLAYLHSAAYPPIYHRDVKSSNILLDDDLNVKVSDFGLSRLASFDASHISTCAQGTIGYLDPEYYRNYQLTDRSDVYSFGVVLLELVTSQRAIDFGRDPDDVNLATLALSRQESGRLLEVADPQVKDTTWPTTLDTVLATALLAISCTQPSRVDRPAMKEVAEELQVIIEIEESGEKVGAHSLHKLGAWSASDLQGEYGRPLFDLQRKSQKSASASASQQSDYSHQLDDGSEVEEDEEEEEEEGDPDRSAEFSDCVQQTVEHGEASEEQQQQGGADVDQLNVDRDKLQKETFQRR